MSLQQLLYISDAVRPMTGDDLQRLLDVARPYNREVGITGVLFYSGGHFVQFIEGPHHEIDHLMDRIRADQRHHHLRVLLNHPAHQRLFDRWEMGILDMDFHGEGDRRKLHKLIQLAGSGQKDEHGTPLELILLSEFCMLLPAPA